MIVWLVGMAVMDDRLRAERDVVMEYLENNPLVAMVHEGTTESGETVRWNMVVFNANYIATEQQFNQK